MTVRWSGEGEWNITIRVFRDLGIVSYGYEPTATPDEDASGVHGNDERVTVENVRRGVRMMLEIVRRFVTDDRVISDR